MSAPPASPPRALKGTSLFRRLGLLLGLVSASLVPASADIVWDFATASPTSGVPANLTVSDVSQGNNFGTTAMITSASVSSGYAGASGTFNAGAAARVGALNTATDGSAYFEVTLTPAASFQVVLNGLTFGCRRTGTGPQAFTLRTSADGFTNDTATGPLTASGTWVLQTINSLAVSSATPLVLRLYGHNGSGNAASGTANWRIDDLALNVTVNTASGTPPTLTNFTPDTGLPGTVVTITGTNFGAAPTVSFNGTAAPGATVNGAGTQITVAVPNGATTGNILVSGPGGSVASSSPFTVPAQPTLTVNLESTTIAENENRTSNIISRPLDAPTNAITINLTSSNPAKATVSPATVTISADEVNSTPFTITGVPDNVFGPAANVTITASTTGYTNGTAVLTITNVDAPPPAAPPTVVVNKYLNGSPDLVELLVIGNETPGATLDMRGMILKDFSSNMNSDGGGSFTFTEDALLSTVKVGTLLVLSLDTVSTDTDPSDFSLRLGLRDPTWFTATTAGFDISTTDMVMIKQRDIGAPGVIGAIHALAGGSAGTLFNDTISVKLIAPGTSGTGRAVVANTFGATLADFGGTDATGNVLLAPSAFGSANSTGNNTYIRQLRGLTNLDGAGTATVTNVTPGSPLLSKNIFQRNATGQSAAFNIAASATPGVLTSVRLTVPAGFSAPLAANVTVSGPGAASPSVSVSGRDITVSNLTVSTTETAELVLSGLTIANPDAITDDGYYAFPMAVAGTAGTLTPVPTPPLLIVTIPIANLRDVDAGGTSLDVGKIVAIEGVCTEDNFNTAELSAFIQDGPAGINVFNFDLEGSPLTRGDRYIISGPILMFRGLTEINPPDAGSIINLGAATPVTPLTISIADLLLDAEAYEGRLITVTGLSRTSTEADTWATATTITLMDAMANTLDIRIQAGSTALLEPNYPAAITGIFGQFASTAAPFSGGYQLMPRDQADLSGSAVNSTYATWAAGFPGIGGAEADADKDGQSNFMEFALGTIPNNSSSIQQPNLAPIAGEPGFGFSKGQEAGGDPSVLYTIEGTTDLTTWTPATLDGTVFALFENDSSTVRAQYLGTSAKVFWRLKVSSTP